MVATLFRVKLKRIIILEDFLDRVDKPQFTTGLITKVKIRFKRLQLSVYRKRKFVRIKMA